jgi:hypothetical protein
MFHYSAVLIHFFPTLFIFATQLSRHRALIIIFPLQHFMTFRLLKPAFVDLNFPSFFPVRNPQSVQSERTADILPLDRSTLTQWKICIYHV